MFRALLMILVLCISIIPGKAKTTNPGKIWLSSIYEHLQKSDHSYPEATKRGESGNVRIEFVLRPSGKLIEAKVARSSGFADLDSEALAMFKRAAPFPPAPAWATEDHYELTVSMTFAKSALVRVTKHGLLSNGHGYFPSGQDMTPPPPHAGPPSIQPRPPTQGQPTQPESSEEQDKRLGLHPPQ
jgi:TonB family protein